MPLSPQLQTTSRVPGLYDIFWATDSEWDQKYRFRKSSDGSNDLKIFENALDVEKSKFENHIESGPITYKMMRRFQIWPQNSNWMRFEPLFGRKTVESRDALGIFENIPIFDSFFLPKRGLNVILFEL